MQTPPTGNIELRTLKKVHRTHTISPSRVNEWSLALEADKSTYGCSASRQCDCSSVSSLSLSLSLTLSDWPALANVSSSSRQNSKLLLHTMNKLIISPDQASKQCLSRKHPCAWKTTLDNHKPLVASAGTPYLWTSLVKTISASLLQKDPLYIWYSWCCFAAHHYPPHCFIKLELGELSSTELN